MIKSAIFSLPVRESAPGTKTLVAEVQVEFLDVYKIEADGTMIFDHRQFFKPARIVSLRYK